MTTAQQRLLEEIKAHGDQAEYWPVVNDWVKDSGPAKSLALRNINQTVGALVRDGYVTLDDDGLFQLTERGRARVGGAA